MSRQDSGKIPLMTPTHGAAAAHAKAAAPSPMGPWAMTVKCRMSVQAAHRQWRRRRRRHVIGPPWGPRAGLEIF